MELGGDEVRVIREFDHLHQLVVGRDSRQPEAGSLEVVAIAVVHLVSMSVPLVHDGLPVEGAGDGVFGQPGRIEAEAHCSTLVLDVSL